MTMSQSLARAFALALSLSAALGTVHAQAPVQTFEAVFASLVEAAHEQRLAHPTPTPTAVRRAALLDRRQQTSAGSPTLTFVTAAPDSTCGFLSASPGNGITCENGGICSWEGDHVSAIICADIIKGISFSAKLACFERTVATDTAICNDMCQENQFNLLCTNESAPFCRTYIYPGNIRDFRCASTTVTRPQNVDFTYKGQTDREFNTVTWGASEPLSVPPSTAPTSSDEPRQSTSTESSTTVSETPSETPTPAPASRTNIGAIVGGAVGGAALLALIGFGVYFMRRHSAKKAALENAQPPPSHMQQPPPVQQYYPTPVSPTGTYGWKGGATSPVHSHLGTSPGGQPYDAVSDIQSSRMSQAYSPGPMGPTQPTNTPGTIHEVGPDSSGHHRGNLHEIG